MTASLHLIVRIAGERVAFPACDVEAVIEVDALTTVPRAASHVAGLAALRSRVLTVIDGAASLGLGRHSREGCSEAVVLQWEGHDYALLLDAVEDAVELEAMAASPPVAPDGSWARVARGLVEHEGTALLVVAPALLAAGPPPEPAPRPAVNPLLTGGA